MKKRLMFIIVLLVCMLLVGCYANKGDSGFDGYIKGEYAPSSSMTDYVGGIIDGEITGGEIIEKDPSVEEPDTSEKGDEQIRAGQLTVCAYNDNDNWDFYKSLITRGQESNGAFYEYNKFGLASNRIELTLSGASYVKCELLNDNDEVEFSTWCDQNGKCYLFNNTVRESYKVKFSYNKDGNSLSEIRDVNNGDVIDLGIDKVNNNIIQLMFVVDTTGSMGDEISYLKAEIKNVFEEVKNSNEGATIYLALMFYRDNGDDYVTRYFDFTTDIDSQVSNLSKQYASGGGDFEEAVQEAFGLACKKQWLMNNATKVLVHVADAPSHDEDVKNWFGSVNKLASFGVRIINVASSGIDKQTEYLFRNECFMTNGYYCYLTNDSGIGGDHIEATVYEKPTVEYLNKCLIRLINGMHTGVMEDAIYYKQAN